MEIREALILSAGLGTRLRPITRQPKFMFKIGGRPLIHYPILSLKNVGVRKFNIVVASSYKKLLIDAISEVLRSSEYQVIPNSKPELGNGYSLLLAEEYAGDIFFLSMCDHIYSPKIPEILLKKYKETIDVLVGADSKPKYVDVGEATKITCDEEGKVVRIGKNLENYTHVDIGLFIMRNTIFEVGKRVSRSAEITLTNILNRAVKEKFSVYVADVEGEGWTDIDTPRDVLEVTRGGRSKILEYIKEYWV